ncbi:MAG: hypothetical protein DWQ47_11310 [Acidobacteria bacterium]|nr:MAG: hypothetical protein DWQ32_13725 [Acidobacteriota bacterium]REJ98165.1 MAG: hypothetical protein DWQ38_16525 [Acidobacteriota bacterium]REK16908.1 MAG: hypothetical protein DWQ43_01570 [Acidobacteriota bacterium]REK42819.1 MAG: hypothetical protein DWQ47_11310 [Acidobacteriota bacterium]
MSFDIFAAGTPNFHFSRDNNPDDDVFSTAEVLNILSALGPHRNQVGLAIEETLAPDNFLNALKKLAETEVTHLFNSAAGFLALQKRARQGWIAISTRETHTFWVDTTGFSKYTFSPGSNPGRELFKAIKKDLDNTDMNNWGVLRMIAIVMTLYKNHLKENDHVMLSIELTN